MLASDLIKRIKEAPITTQELPIVVDGVEIHGVSVEFDEEVGYYFNIIT